MYVTVLSVGAGTSILLLPDVCVLISQDVQHLCYQLRPSITLYIAQSTGSTMH
jgi:hypothetical protein